VKAPYDCKNTLSVFCIAMLVLSLCASCTEAQYKNVALIRGPNYETPAERRLRFQSEKKIKWQKNIGK